MASKFSSGSCHEDSDGDGASSVGRSRWTTMVGAGSEHQHNSTHSALDQQERELRRQQQKQQVHTIRRLKEDVRHANKESNKFKHEALSRKEEVAALQDDIQHLMTDNKELYQASKKFIQDLAALQQANEELRWRQQELEIITQQQAALCEEQQHKKESQQEHHYDDAPSSEEQSQQSPAGTDDKKDILHRSFSAIPPPASFPDQRASSLNALLLKHHQQQQRSRRCTHQVSATLSQSKNISHLVAEFNASPSPLSSPKAELKEDQTKMISTLRKDLEDSKSKNAHFKEENHELEVMVEELSEELEIMRDQFHEILGQKHTAERELADAFSLVKEKTRVECKLLDQLREFQKHKIQEQHGHERQSSGEAEPDRHARAHQLEDSGGQTLFGHFKHRMSKERHEVLEENHLSECCECPCHGVTRRRGAPNRNWHDKSDRQLMENLTDSFRYDQVNESPPSPSTASKGWWFGGGQKKETTTTERSASEDEEYKNAAVLSASEGGSAPPRRHSLQHVIPGDLMFSSSICGSYRSRPDMFTSGKENGETEGAIKGSYSGQDVPRSQKPTSSSPSRNIPAVSDKKDPASVASSSYNMDQLNTIDAEAASPANEAYMQEGSSGANTTTPQHISSTPTTTRYRGSSPYHDLTVRRRNMVNPMAAMFAAWPSWTHVHFRIDQQNRRAARHLSRSNSTNSALRRSISMSRLRDTGLSSSLSEQVMTMYRSSTSLGSQDQRHGSDSGIYSAASLGFGSSPYWQQHQQHLTRDQTDFLYDHSNFLPHERDTVRNMDSVSLEAPGDRGASVSLGDAQCVVIM
jgi:hypothetical protein